MNTQQMQQMTGMGGSPLAPSSSSSLPVAAKKKTRRGSRGRGGSKGKSPLQQHHAAFNQAHAAGNHAAARVHALNYAKASMGGATMPPEPDTDDMGEAPGADDITMPQTAPTQNAKTPAVSPAARLAAALRARK